MKKRIPIPTITITITRLGVTLSVAMALLLTIAGAGCETTGGKEGDRCNPLVLRDECHSGLRCTPFSCSEAYCCATDRPTADPHCHADGCPDPTTAADDDAGDADAVTDADADADAAAAVD